MFGLTTNILKIQSDLLAQQEYVASQQCLPLGQIGQMSNNKFQLIDEMLMSFDQAQHFFEQNEKSNNSTMNLMGQEDIFGMTYYIITDKGDFYEDWIHGIRKYWEETSKKIEQDPDYVYSCDANPLESELERSNPQVLQYRNMTVLVLFLMAFLSMITCLFVSGTIYFDKNLRNAHPSILLGTMSIAEYVTCYSAFFWQLNTVKVVCYFGLNNVYQKSVQYLLWILQKDYTKFTNEMAISQLVHGNKYMFEAFQLLSLCLNACLCIDLYLTFRNPFYPSSRRMKAYLFGSVLITCVFGVYQNSILATNKTFYFQYIQPILENEAKEKNGGLEQQILSGQLKEDFKNFMLDKAHRSSIYTFISTGIIMVYMLIATFSMGFAKLAKIQADSSLGSQIFAHFLEKYISYIRFFTILWVASLANGLYQLNYNYLQIWSLNTYGSYEGVAQNTVQLMASLQVLEVNIAIQLFQGFILGLVRTNEPLFNQLIMKELHSWFGELMPDHETHKELKKLTSFGLMNEQLSIDLLYTILIVITEHSVGIKKRTHWYEYLSFDFTNKNTFVIESMIVENPEKFSVVKEDKVACKSAKIKFVNRSIEDFDVKKMSSQVEQVNYDETPGQDFKMKENISVRVMDKTIECTEFAPDVFAHLRDLDGLKNSDLQESLDPIIKGNIKQILKSGEGMGKSGSFFFFSHDDRFLIKSMTTDDFNTFMKLFRSYFEHVNCFDGSLLARVYGIYSVKMADMNPVYLICMGNTKPCKSEHIKKIYDLKGSMVKREVHGNEDTFEGTKVLKDKNFLNLKEREVFLKFRNKDANSIMQQIAYDICLLNQFDIMDYSLLTVVVYNPDYIKKHPEQFLHDENGVLVLPVQEIQKQKIIKSNFKSKKSYKRNTDKFLQKMSGFTADEYAELKKQNSNEHFITVYTSGETSTVFNFKSMKAIPSEKITFVREFFEENVEKQDKKKSKDLQEKFVKNNKMRNSFLSKHGKYIYYLGIIDYLQEYNISKQGENFFKGYQYGKNKHLISAVPPKKYRNRFFDFMQNHVVINQAMSQFVKTQIKLEKQVQKMINIKEKCKF